MSECHPTGMGGPSFEVMDLGLAMQTTSSPKIAIDFGAGAGRNSVFLASVGFNVTAVERDIRLASQLVKYQRLGRPAIQVRQIDVQEYEFDTTSDIVLLLGILHFLDKGTARQLVDDCKNNSNSGAVHVVTVSPETGESPLDNSLLEQGYIASVSLPDLFDWYGDWEILSDERYVKIDSHENGRIETHPIAKIVFRNPESARNGAIKSRELSWANWQNCEHRILRTHSQARQLTYQKFGASTERKTVFLFMWLKNLRSPPKDQDSDHMNC